MNSPFPEAKAGKPPRLLRPSGGWVTLFAVLALAAAGWAYLVAGAGMDMPADPAAGDSTGQAWSAGYLLTVLVMWVVMMVAMMLPSALPMFLLHRRVVGSRCSVSGSSWRSGVFAAGYLLVWTGFGLAATAVQWWLDQVGLLSAAMAFDSRPVTAALLLAAGLYQLTPIKQACLRHCRSPLSFLAQHWQDGCGGTLAMGVGHGFYCVGCCWALMALLFAGGVMNLLWIVGLTLWVFIEKAAPGGRWLGNAMGVVLMAAAVTLLLA